jgi:hypothetical protein
LNPVRPRLLPLPRLLIAAAHAVAACLIER